MLRYVAWRLAWMGPSLLIVTLVTFALLDLAPHDRASLALGGSDPVVRDRQQRAAAVAALRAHYGQLDPVTLEPRPWPARYADWLRRAALLDFAGPGEDSAAFHARLWHALPVTLLLQALALALSVAGGVALGAWLGMRAGSVPDRALGPALLALFALPEFLVATLLVLLLGGGLFAPLLPVQGLHSPGAAAWSRPAQFLDMLAHLPLPVLALALGPFVVITRFVRDGVARAARSDFVLALRGLGASERHVRRRALRAGVSPLLTLLGTMLPALVAGSVVVERIFNVRGVGSLAFEAVVARDYAMVMATTILGSVATLLGLLVSDLLQRAADPRVELR
jgi:peptide/nickel transport system permease protein